MRGGHRWSLGLGAAMLLGLVLRLWYAAAATKTPGFGGDDDWYHQVANLVADGRGFTEPFVGAGGGLVPNPGDGPPTAFHPPLFSLLLAVVSKLGLTSYEAHQVAGCVLGALTVGGIGLLARRLAGDRAGLLAAVLAAVSLPLIANDSLLMSESLAGLLTVAVLLAALALLRRPTIGHAVLLGAAIGLAALTRGEALLLVALLGIPVAWRAWGRLAVIAVVAVVVVAPWTIRNASAFDRFVPITTGEGTVFAGANAPSTYHGALIGFWNINEVFRAIPHPPENEADANDEYRRIGVDYARDHADRIPAVVVVRVLRTWGLWSPSQQRDIGTVINGRIRALEWPAFGMYLAFLALGLAGAVVARRRRLPGAWVLAAPVVLVTITSAVGYGTVRCREPADVVLVVLAAIALDALVSRARG